MEAECKGECVPLQIALQPYAIFIKGKNLMGTTVRRQFTVSMVIDLFTYLPASQWCWVLLSMP